MITEEALVVSTESTYIKVVVQKQSGCSSCLANSSCSTSAIARFFGNKVTELKLLNTLDVKTGDRVLVAVEESVFLITACITYLIPLFFFLISAVITELIFSHEGLTLLVSILGFVSGILLARQLKYIFPLQPYLLSKI